MIRVANYDDYADLAEMLRAMTKELWPEYASDDIKVYEKAVTNHLFDTRDTVYLDDRGFFIVRDETEAITPKRKIYNGIRLYIKPEYRKTSALADYYKQLFRDFKDGEIWGMTEAHSDHIRVLDKRHELVGKVYKLGGR